MTRQIIIFQIGDQFLGVDIMAVREIRAWTAPTLLPHVPGHVRGVVNLRGTVLPVIDLTALLGWGQAEPTARHVIIVVRVDDQLKGLIVDAVNDIVAIDETSLQPAPELGENRAADALDGILSVNDRMVMLLALDKLALQASQLPMAEAA